MSSARIIKPHDFDERYLPVLLRLEPYRAFKYLTIPWLHFLCRPEIEYSVFRRYLGYLRQAPNRYIRCPEQQNASPNVPYKTLVYELAGRGVKLLQDRGLMPAIAPAKRSRTATSHRAHSYYHEIIVDLGYFAPLHHLVRLDPALRVIDVAQLLEHRNVPQATRALSDPLLVTLKGGHTRFDGTPHVLSRADNGRPLSIGIPGIEVDRGTETLERVEAHLRNAAEYITTGQHEKVWGFANCMIPFLFTSEARKARAMAYVESEIGKFPFLLFKTVPDIGLLRHFPKPAHYERSHRPASDDPPLPANIHVFTTPWQRVGHSDFRLDTFEECP